MKQRWRRQRRQWRRRRPHSTEQQTAFRRRASREQCWSKERRKKENKESVWVRTKRELNTAAWNMEHNETKWQDRHAESAIKKTKPHTFRLDRTRAILPIIPLLLRWQPFHFYTQSYKLTYDTELTHFTCVYVCIAVCCGCGCSHILNICVRQRAFHYICNRNLYLWLNLLCLSI